MHGTTAVARFAKPFGMINFKFRFYIQLLFNYGEN
jgi:hypothetical protein